MTSDIFESVGLERGVLALESIGVADFAGIIPCSFDTTNTPDSPWESRPQVTSPGRIDATLREAFDRYDNLLRRLSD